MLAKAFISVGVAAFLFLGFFGLAHAGMQVSGEGHSATSHCAQMVQGSALSLPVQCDPFLLILLSAMLLLFVVLQAPLFVGLFSRRYSRQFEDIPRTPLQDFYSRGILNPKVF